MGKSAILSLTSDRTKQRRKFMPEVKGMMVEKLSEAEIQDLIKTYTALGWQFQNLTELGGHRLLTFVWEHDGHGPLPQGKE